MQKVKLFGYQTRFSEVKHSPSTPEATAAGGGRSSIWPWPCPGCVTYAPCPDC